jgi:hypothetical protein
MRRKIIAALTLACCAGVAAPALTATPAAATAAKRSLRGCHDGKCTFTFRKPVRFHVAKRYGLSWVRVARYNAGMIVVSGPGVASYLGEGGSGSISGGSADLNFRVLAITSKGAKIRFTG